MKATHKVYVWFKYHGAREFTRSLQSYRARIKKNGTIMYWVGVSRVCRGPYPPYVSYLSKEDLNAKRLCRTQDSFGKIKKYQVYYTLEPMGH